MGGAVYIVDDDEAIRDSLGYLFQSRGVAAEAFESAEAFLDRWRPGLNGCLLLDIRMEPTTGLELFDRLRDAGERLPVIFLTGHADVPMAVAAMKKGAHDFVEKPFNDNDLVDRVIAALAWSERQRVQAGAAASVAARLDTLTRREREVMERVLAGTLNKVIADELGITMRTVEVHRSRVFEKMEVKTAVELARVLTVARRGG